MRTTRAMVHSLFILTTLQFDLIYCLDILLSDTSLSNPLLFTILFGSSCFYYIPLTAITRNVVNSTSLDYLYAYNMKIIKPKQYIASSNTKLIHQSHFFLFTEICYFFYLCFSCITEIVQNNLLER